MWFNRIYGNVGINWRLGRAIRGIWRILDGLVEGGLDRKFGVPRW
jgi:hypothetical protein